MTDPAFRPAVELAAALRRGEMGSLELLEHFLARVERLNPTLNAVVAVDPEGARERARAADAARARGEVWGPLHGLPVTVKDSIEVAGMPCTSGAPELKHHVPERSAPAVQRLVDAGAVVFGKTNLPMWAGDFQTWNDLFGTTGNPWDPARIPGGSSGGAAAAVAAGLTGLELGSDIAGSIRNPAHFCGVYGHKPSQGIVPGRGHIPGPPGQRRRTDLGVLGPLARDAADLAAALDLLAGPDEPEETAWRLVLPPPRRDLLGAFRVAVWLDAAPSPLDAEVGDVLQAAVDALARAGVPVREARPDFDPDRVHALFLRLLFAEFAAGVPKAIRERLDEALPGLDPDGLGHEAGVVRGVAQRHRDWIRADEERHRLRARWRDFFGDVDVLLAPVHPTVAYPHDHDEATRAITVNGDRRPYTEQFFWAGVFGVAGLPATVAPVGRSRSGLPVGLQVVGPFLEDRTPLRFAELLRTVVGGYERPPLP